MQANTPVVPVVVLGSWSELGAVALPLRIEVFVHEQGVPEALEQDDADANATHAVILHNSDAVGTGRWVLVGPSTAKIGRLAVRRSHRGQGVGRRILTSLVQDAIKHEINELRLHAQCDAIEFYEREGFFVVGDPFLEAGIEHVLMTRQL